MVTLRPHSIKFPMHWGLLAIRCEGYSCVLIYSYCMTLYCNLSSELPRSCALRTCIVWAYIHTCTCLPLCSVLGVCRSDTLEFSVCVVVSLGCLITYVQYIHRIGTPHCVCALCNGEPAATCIASRGVLISFHQSCVAYTAKIVLPWVQSPMHHILHLS